MGSPPPVEGEEAGLLRDVVGFLTYKGDRELGGVREGREGYNEPSVISSNKMMVRSVADRIREIGGEVRIFRDGDMEGEARVVGVELVDALEKQGAGKGTFLIAGGETTVTFCSALGNGKGGRNQEMALAMALELSKRDMDDVVAVCFGTDGNDGPTDAAGAIVDGTTVRKIWEQAKERGGAKDAVEYAKVRMGEERRTREASSLMMFYTIHQPPLLVALLLAPLHSSQSYLERHDAYNYFAGSEYLIKCGATGTNVADVVVLSRM